MKQEGLRVNKKLLVLLCFVMMLSIVAACSGNNANNEQTPENTSQQQSDNNKSANNEPNNEPENEPESNVVNDETATISVVWVADEAYADLMTKNEIIKEKFPNVTFEFNVVGDLERMVTAQEQIDIINY